MRPLLAARLSRALVDCYPPRWKQRYQEEILDVLDQHRASPRTVLSLVGGAVTAHMDPSYRMEKPVIRIRNNAVRAVLIVVAGCMAVIALLYSLFTYTNPLLAVLKPGSSNALWGEAFSPDSKLLAAAYGGSVALWDLAHPAQPRLLTVLDAHVGPVTHADIAFSPDGHLLALASGNGQATIWNVARRARAAPVATVTGRDGYFQALAFSPRGDLLAGVTTGGTVLVYRLDDLGRPTLTASRSGLAAQALYPGGVRAPARLAASCPGCMTPSYALGFAPGGRALTVVLDKIFPNNSSRDTAFTWQVTASGNLTGGISAARDTWDGQPALAPDGRTVVDGSAFGRTAVGLWELPAPAG